MKKLSVLFKQVLRVAFTPPPAIRAAAAVALLALGLAAPAAHAALNVVATTSDVAALAKTVGGDDVTIITLARPTEDPHFVDARPSFLRHLSRADLLIEGGADLEAGWLPPLVNNARNRKILSGAAGRFLAAEHVRLRDIPATLDRSQGDVHAHGNPHFLLDPANAALVANALAEKLAALDPAKAAAHRARAKKFSATLDGKRAEWNRRLVPFRGAGVVTYHRSFDYFLAAFHLNLSGTIEPKPGIEPSASHLVALTAQMKREKVRLILTEPNRPIRTCTRVAAQSGAKLVRAPLMPLNDDYLAFIEAIVTGVESALRPE
ncbi:MAG: metal ABC transporter substrate-binding protein [Puniceicoccales bacterium]|jgi:zinc/manganese transport system substrate-binding protein|nr:metal ABC transporter substrate-binding protein [Puniceicoccales bacterium]